MDLFNSSLCSQGLAVGTMCIPYLWMLHLGSLPTVMENNCKKKKRDRFIIADLSHAVRPGTVVSIQNISLSFIKAHEIATIEPQMVLPS